MLGLASSRRPLSLAASVIFLVGVVRKKTIIRLTLFVLFFSFFQTFLLFIIFLLIVLSEADVKTQRSGRKDADRREGWRETEGGVT